MSGSAPPSSSSGTRRRRLGFAPRTGESVHRIRLTMLRSGLAALQVALLAVTALWGGSSARASTGEISSVLQKCQVCHRGIGAMAGLDLSNREGALFGGSSGPALEPGASAKSLLFQRVLSGEMPPSGPLSKGEVDLVRHWIDQGAVWPSGDQDGPQAGAASPEPLWWSLKPVHRPAVPVVKQATWVRKPIDAFILAALEEQGLKPSPPAPREVLIRRATLDLLGLPPKPGEIEAFVSDTSPRAYENLVNRLLASPHYGERWGRHWLDLARFGESQGFERDKIRDHAWPYRDYVIRSFNQDKPYARFVQEQLAGDVLEPRSRDGVAATGFLVAAPWDEVGNTQQSAIMRARVRAEEMEEMVGTVAQTFLGMTVNCARCHDHKFDPISQRDYYRLKASLDGIRPGNRPWLTPAETAAHEERTEPVRDRIRRLKRRLAQIQEKVRERVLRKRGIAALPVPEPIARWTFDLNGIDSVGHGHLSAESGALVEDGGFRFEEGAIRFKDAEAQSEALTVDLAEKTLEAWVRVSKEKHGFHFFKVEDTDSPLPRGRFDAIYYHQGSRTWRNLSEFKNRTVEPAKPKETRTETPIHVAIAYDSRGGIRIYREGLLYWVQDPKGEGPESALQFYPRSRTRIVFGGNRTGAVEEARLYDRPLTSEEIAASFRAGIQRVTPEEWNAEAESQERLAREELLDEVARQERLLEDAPPVPLVYAARTYRSGPHVIMERGDPATPGDPVEPGGLLAIPSPEPEFGLPPDGNEAERRLRLAEWITDPDHPLTARVLVNRVWHYHFGRGIVSTPNDFGFNGGRASHPELLDWLAQFFLRQGGSVKQLHREIMLSNTYRQSSGFRADAAEADAENRWLWRFAPRRLEAEVIRDSLLAVSGRLNREFGGPGFRPFEVKLFNSHFYNLVDSADLPMRKRTIYRIVVRSGHDPMLEAFDCPDASEKAPRRSHTTTPIQALALMNSPFVLRQADHLADRLRWALPGDSEGQIDLAYRLALGRRPNSEESGRARAHAGDQGLESFCWALLNSSEFLYLN